MTEFIRPKISSESIEDNHAIFRVEPLERGFGYTLGNSLRRVLLSSLPGAAITSVRISGTSHEFSTINGIREDVVDIILNLKGIVIKLYEEDSAILKLKEKGEKKVTAGDIEAPSEVDIVNTKHHIATLNDKGKLEIEMFVKRGRGYIPAEENKEPGDSIDVIPIDSLFSPVRSVTYEVENTRVGQRTDYDKLILDVQTNGSISPSDSVAMAGKIINEHMNLFIEQSIEEAPEQIFKSEKSEYDKMLEIPVEDLDLSVRSYNCLKRQGVNTLGQLIDYSESELVKIRNFGAKSINEVREKLNEMNLSLKG